MLRGDFFTITHTELIPEDASLPGTEQFILTVGLNPRHPIYDGHFPGNPVVPGVCQVQMVKEGLEAVRQTPGLLTSAGNIKFLNMIVPSEHPQLTIRYKTRTAGPDTVDFSATISSGSTIFLKINGMLCTKPS